MTDIREDIRRQFEDLVVDGPDARGPCLLEVLSEIADLVDHAEDASVIQDIQEILGLELR